MTYLLERLVVAYQQFEIRLSSGGAAGTKQGRAREFVLRRGPSAFRISEVRRAIPGVSDSTIRLVLGQLKAEDEVVNDGTGRGAEWRRGRPGAR